MAIVRFEITKPSCNSTNVRLVLIAKLIILIQSNSIQNFRLNFN